MTWFPYAPRPHQDRAVQFAFDVFGQGTVGLLSADCGIGKTIAVLSGYLAARAEDSDFRLFILTRTHSQARVFESELRTLNASEQAKASSLYLTATSMVSRVHVCPLRSEIQQSSIAGFTRGCASMIKSGRCTYYYNMYKRDKSSNTVRLRKQANDELITALKNDIVTRETAEEFQTEHGYCPYEVLRWCARNSRVVIGPYSYIFHDRVRTAFLKSMGVKLESLDLIVDEAHNLPGHVLNVESAQLTGRDLQWLRENKQALEITTGVRWLGDAIDFLWETFMLSLDRLGSRKERVLNHWEIFPRFISAEQLVELQYPLHDVIEPAEESSRSNTPLERLIDLLMAGHRAVIGGAWHITLERLHQWNKETSLENAVLKVRPLNAAGFTAPILHGSRSSILMSGTLHPLDHYMSLLGVSHAMTESLISPYERGSRLVLLDRQISTKYTRRSSQLWQDVAERIGTALTTMPANKSALIAFPSYKIMNEVLSYEINYGYRKRLVEEPHATIETLKNAVDESPHAVFCVYGGKFSEGIDLIRDGSSQLDLIIGVGIPFSPPTSYHKALQEWYDQRYGPGVGYYFSTVVPSIRKVAQLIGRLRRSPQDWGIVVLLDSRFQKYLNVFGADMVSDIWPYESSSEMAFAIKMFLQNRGLN